METGITKNQILSALAKSPHGKLEEYIAIGVAAAKQEPEFFAHLIAWNQIKGEIRDAKVALPIVSLMAANFVAEPELLENSLAHLARLGPRELLRAYRFALSSKPRPAKTRRLKILVGECLHEIEADRRDWTRTAVQHRATLKELYAVAHRKPGSDYIDRVIMRGENPIGSVFEVISKLKDMSAEEAATEITQRQIPFLIASGALGKKAKEPALVQALIERMSPTELVTNTKMLEKLGVKSNPALRASFEAGLARASTSKKNLLKTTRAAEALGETSELGEKLRGLQERQIKNSAGIEGDWLVLGDKSPSMASCIEAARMVAATLAKFVKGQVHLVFFDEGPRYFDVTGKDYDQILKETRHVLIGAGTSIGCGVQYALEKKFNVDGIAIVSDAAENSAPRFTERYKKLCEVLGKEPPVYLYRFASSMRAMMDVDLAVSMQREGLELSEFDLRRGVVDYYSLANLVQTMRVSRYGLVEEVYDTPLLKLSNIFKHAERKEVAHAI
jgi:hypothetical protein